MLGDVMAWSLRLFVRAEAGTHAYVCGHGGLRLTATG